MRLSPMLQEIELKPSRSSSSLTSVQLRVSSFSCCVPTLLRRECLFVNNIVHHISHFTYPYNRLRIESMCGVWHATLNDP